MENGGTVLEVAIQCHTFEDNNPGKETHSPWRHIGHQLLIPWVPHWMPVEHPLPPPVSPIVLSILPDPSNHSFSSYQVPATIPSLAILISCDGVELLALLFVRHLVSERLFQKYELQPTPQLQFPARAPPVLIF